MPRVFFIIINPNLIPIFEVRFFNGLLKIILNCGFEKIFNLTMLGTNPDDKGMMSMTWISELENNFGEI